MVPRSVGLRHGYSLSVRLTVTICLLTVLFLVSSVLVPAVGEPASTQNFNFIFFFIGHFSYLAPGQYGPFPGFLQ